MYIHIFIFICDFFLLLEYVLICNCFAFTRDGTWSRSLLICYLAVATCLTMSSTFSYVQGFGLRGISESSYEVPEL